MTMLPQPGRPEPEERALPDIVPESPPAYYPDIQRRGRKYSSKTKILAYALLAGTLLAFFFSLTHAIIALWAERDSALFFFGERERPTYFFPSWIRLFGIYAPFFILAAAMAAAAEYLVRRSLQASSQHHRALIDAIRALSHDSAGEPPSRQKPEMVDPLRKNLKLEIDPQSEER
jgi:hypothetical protein